MSEYQPSDIRIGDAEREQAIQALGEHMSIGRLDIEEYGDRSAKVATAKTRGELVELFADLPDPRPSFAPPRPAASTPRPATPPAQVNESAQPAQRTTTPQRVAGSIMPVVSIVAVILFFTLHSWIFFLAIPLAGAILGAIFGDEVRHHDWHHNRSAWHAQRHVMRHQMRMQRRNSHRDWRR